MKKHVVGIFQAHGEAGEWHDVESILPASHDAFVRAWRGGKENNALARQVNPIAALRGLPADFLMADKGLHPLEANAYRSKDKAAGFSFADTSTDTSGCLMLWMGEHSHSWLDVDEVLVAPEQLLFGEGDTVS